MKIKYWEENFISSLFTDYRPKWRETHDNPTNIQAFIIIFNFNYYLLARDRRSGYQRSFVQVFSSLAFLCRFLNISFYIIVVFTANPILNVTIRIYAMVYLCYTCILNSVRSQRRQRALSQNRFLSTFCLVFSTFFYTDAMTTSFYCVRWMMQRGRQWRRLVYQHCPSIDYNNQHLYRY